MPRKSAGISLDEVEELEALYLQLRANSTSSEARIKVYSEAKKRMGPNAARLAFMLHEANVPLTQLTHHYAGGPGVQNNNPGGATTNVSQTAFGNMTGVNATGEQKIRDITVYSQDLDQTGASINAEVRSALVKAREAIEQASLSPALKPTVIEQFDKMTEELKKGEKKDAGLISGLWSMVVGAVKAFPAAVSALDTLKDLIGA